MNAHAFVVEPDARNPRRDERLDEVLECVHEALSRVQCCLRIDLGRERPVDPCATAAAGRDVVERGGLHVAHRRKGLRVERPVLVYPTYPYSSNTSVKLMQIIKYEYNKCSEATREVPMTS